MLIQNSTQNDIETIFSLYQKATAYQGIHFPDNQWPQFSRSMVIAEIEEKRQWKLVVDGKITGVWVTTFTDPQIWEERNNDPAVYIHRIVVNPQFRGQNLIQKIVKWSETYAKENNKRFIRLDTCGNNQKLIQYYKNGGFQFLGMWQLKNTDTLPSHYQCADVCFFEIAL